MFLYMPVGPCLVSPLSGDTWSYWLTSPGNIKVPNHFISPLPEPHFPWTLRCAMWMPGALNHNCPSCLRYGGPPSPSSCSCGLLSMVLRSALRIVQCLHLGLASNKIFPTVLEPMFHHSTQVSGHSCAPNVSVRSPVSLDPTICPKSFWHFTQVLEIRLWVSDSDNLAFLDWAHRSASQVSRTLIS